MKLRLVKDWRSAWKWLSVHVAGAGAIAAVAYENIDAVQAYVSPTCFHYLVVGLSVLTIAGRLVDQGDK